MKDINGKTLNEGDVCVVYPSKNIFCPLSDEHSGELVVVIRLNLGGVWPVLCDKGYYTTLRSPTELEIIGDVR